MSFFRWVYKETVLDFKKLQFNNMVRIEAGILPSLVEN